MARDGPRPPARTRRRPHETDPESPSYDRLPGRWAWLARLCDEAYGLPRHLSQHSGGMIVSTRPLIDCCPVLPAAMEGRQLCQWDKDSCADAGFLKIDLLGLGMLSAVERCVDEIGRVRGERIDLSRIPYDDRATYDAIQVADTMGVFQIESRAQMASLRRTRPESLEDLTIQVAIVRPGPILGGAVNPYIERRQRLRADPGLRRALRAPVAGTGAEGHARHDHLPGPGDRGRDGLRRLLAGEAEGLRRAMSRKRSAEAIEAYHQRFIDGAAATHGVDAEIAERVYAMIVGFSGFGFPKAHGAAFGLLAYQSTWLRVHHGPEFLCALLNEQPMGFYAPDTLAHEAQRRGIVLLPARRERERGAVHGRVGAGHGGAERGAARRCRMRRRRARRRRAPRPRLHPRRARGGGRARSSPRAARAGRSARSPTSRRAPAPGARRWTGSRGRGRATR